MWLIPLSSWSRVSGKIIVVTIHQAIEWAIGTGVDGYFNEIGPPILAKYSDRFDSQVIEESVSMKSIFSSGMDCPSLDFKARDNFLANCPFGPRHGKLALDLRCRRLKCVVR